MRDPVRQAFGNGNALVPSSCKPKEFWKSRERMMTKAMGLHQFSYIRFLGLLIILGTFVVHFHSNATWVNQKLKGPIVNLEDVWSKTKHGDLAAYSNFVKHHLFRDDSPEQVITVPGTQNSGTPFLEKLWHPVLHIYLFPVRIIAIDDHNGLISKEIFRTLMNRKRISYIYKEKSRPKIRQFHLLQGFSVAEIKRWSLYVFIDGQNVHIFTLPDQYIARLSYNQNGSSTTNYP